VRIVLAGSGRLMISVMNPILDSHHDVAAVIQNGRQVRGIWRRFACAAGPWLYGPLSVLGVARRCGIPIIWIDRMSEAELAPLAALEPDLLLVAGFGIILKKPLLELPKLGCVNLHSALLPKHRGPNPFSAVILAGETETGVTFHVMDEGIDTGDIIAQFVIPLDGDESAGAIYHQLAELGGEHVLEVLDEIERNVVQGAPQDDEQATYEKALKDEDAVIDWNQPAEAIHRLIRAGDPFTMARCRHRGRLVYVQRARVLGDGGEGPPGTVMRVDHAAVTVAAGDGALVLEQCYAQALPWPMPWNRPRPGDRLE
jgi:methionyl-tRNA formyltransferase